MNAKTVKKIRALVRRVNPGIDPRAVRYVTTKNNDKTIMVHPSCFRGMYRNGKRSVREAQQRG